MLVMEMKIVNLIAWLDLKLGKWTVLVKLVFLRKLQVTYKYDSYCILGLYCLESYSMRHTVCLIDCNGCFSKIVLADVLVRIIHVQRQQLHQRRHLFHRRLK